MKKISILFLLALFSISLAAQTESKTHTRLVQLDAGSGRGEFNSCGYSYNGFLVLLIDDQTSEILSAETYINLLSDHRPEEFEELDEKVFGNMWTDPVRGLTIKGECSIIREEGNTHVYYYTTIYPPSDPRYWWMSLIAWPGLEKCHATLDVAYNSKTDQGTVSVRIKATN